MPVYNINKNPYEESIDKIPVVGKLINDYILGRSPEDQIMGVAINVNPARKAAKAVADVIDNSRAAKTLRKMGLEKAPNAGQITDDNTVGAFSALWDKQVRKAIPDQDMTISERIGRIKDKSGNWTEGNTITEGELQDIVNHPQLFEYYPEMRNVRVNVKLDKYAKKPHEGSISDLGITVRGRTRDDIQQTLLHEMQHWIQRKEGTWAQGSNPSTIPSQQVYKEKIKLLANAVIDPFTGRRIVKTPIGDYQAESLGNIPRFLAYWKHAGEAEARDIAEKWLEQSERAGKPWRKPYWSDQPLSSQPVDLKDLIVRTTR